MRRFNLLFLFGGILLGIFSLFSSGLYGQSPEGFNYQAVVRDAGGNVLANQAVSFRMNIREGSATGTAVYTETHAATTNNFGLVNLQIGQGTVVSGTFSNIDWGNNSHFIEIELDETGATAYTSIGTQQLISVPYALHAKTVENDAVDDADADPGNELQTLNISNDSLSIQNGNAIDLSPYLDNTDAQVISISNDTVFLSNGGFAVLPPQTVDTDDQLLSISNDSLTIQDGNTVDLSPYLDNTDAQVISISNDTVFLSNGGFAVLPPQTVDTDDQLLSLSNDSLFIQDGNAVDLSAYLDNTDAQVLSLSNDTLFLSNGGFAILPPSQVLTDTDGDTRIEVESTPDDDIIRFYADTTEYFRMLEGRIEPWNTGESVMIGAGAGLNHNPQSATGNVFIGHAVGQNLTSGGSNVSLGYLSMQNANAVNQNVAIGDGALRQNLAWRNTAVGSGAMTNHKNGTHNVAMGRQAMARDTSGIGNTLIGSAAGFELRNGNGNTGLGRFALQNVTQGDNNVAIGLFAGAGTANHTKSGGVYIGYQAGQNDTASNRLYIENTNSSSPLIYGEFDNDLLAVNGQLGVGTMTPTASLDVKNNAVVGQIGVGGQSDDQAASNDAGLGYTTTPWLYTHAIEAHDERGIASTLITVGNDGTYGASDEIHLVTDGSSRLKVDVNGDVGIGTTNPGARLHVVDRIAGSYYPLKVHNLSNTISSHGVEIAAGSNTSGGSELVVFRRQDFTKIGGVVQNGAGSVQYQTTSDRRLKTDIQPTRFGLGDLMNIQVSDYRYLAEEDKVRTGFIAQQLHGVYPEAVRVGGEDAAEDPWMVDYSQMTPLLVKSVQEQQEVISRQEAQISRQEAEISQLKDEMQELKALIQKVGGE